VACGSNLAHFWNDCLFYYKGQIALIPGSMALPCDISRNYSFSWWPEYSQEFAIQHFPPVIIQELGLALRNAAEILRCAQSNLALVLNITIFVDFSRDAWLMQESGTWPSDISHTLTRLVRIFIAAYRKHEKPAAVSTSGMSSCNRLHVVLIPNSLNIFICRLYCIILS
jgi:hypothetical protein